MTRIGIDGSCWANRRGFGRFTRCLVSEMARRPGSNRLVLVIDEQSLDGAELPPGLEVVAVPVRRQPSRAASADGSRGVLDVLRMSRGARRAGCDVFFFPATYSYYPVLGPPVVVTVHDAIAETFPRLVVPGRRARLLWDLKRRAALLNAKVVVTVSDAAGDDIAVRLGVRPERIRVIREAPAAVFGPLPDEEIGRRLAPLGIGLGERYVLYVGGISPHKNIESLVRAFEEVSAAHPDVRLVLAGELDDDPFLSSVASVSSVISASPARNRILLPGYVPDDQLVALYCGAVATALPSLGEGFGLTAAESAACGTPVVASRIPPLVELLGDAAVYAAPDHPSELARELSGLLDRPHRRDELGRASLRRAEGWSWAGAADAVIGILEEAAAGRSAMSGRR